MAKLYTLYRESENGNLIVEGYAYGDEWVSQALFMGDWKYPTPEAAKEAWEQWLKRGDKK